MNHRLQCPESRARQAADEYATIIAEAAAERLRANTEIDKIIAALNVEGDFEPLERDFEG